MRKGIMKRWLCLGLVLVFFAALAGTATAKTVSSGRADNVFFYVKNNQNESVLLRVMTLSELKELAHGQADGGNYSFSATDNYPTTQYGAARGFTISELLEYVIDTSDVSGVSKLTFNGNDTIRFMATDGYGSYSRGWSYEDLYGATRYYFPDLYDDDIGWKLGWEVAGEDNSKFGLTLEEYNSQYKAQDEYYSEKRQVFASGVETPAILATDSFSGRTTTDNLTNSSEPGISSYIEKNGGQVTGCLDDVLTDTYALRLMLPMTEADLMTAHRTAYDNFKWIYNLRLDMSDLPSLRAQGTVAAPTVSFSRDGDTLTVTMKSSTSGAEIYYGYDGAAQTLYTEPIQIDLSERDVDSNPVTIYAAAVREGWSDEGIQTYKYPGQAPNFQTMYSGMTGQDLVFTAASGVTASEWSAWTEALTFVTLKSPGVNGYVTVDSDLYTVNHTAKTITFDQSLFTKTGSYSFIFHASRYANKNVSVNLKQGGGTLSVPTDVNWGEALTITSSDNQYAAAAQVYVLSEDDSRSLIPSSYLERDGAVLTVKASYFLSEGNAMPKAGTYRLEVVNNQYQPSSQVITVTLQNSFSDVTEGSWYYSYVMDLANANVVNGVGGGRFDPQGELEWGAALKLLMLTTGYEEQAPTGSNWASGYIDRAVADGLIPAAVESTAIVSRLEFCRAAAEALEAETTLTTSPFTDTSDPAVLALYELGIINGVGNDRFDPDAGLTRAEISKIIWGIMNLEEAE